MRDYKLAILQALGVVQRAANLRDAVNRIGRLLQGANEDEKEQAGGGDFKLLVHGGFMTSAEEAERLAVLLRTSAKQARRDVPKGYVAGVELLCIRDCTVLIRTVLWPAPEAKTWDEAHGFKRRKRSSGERKKNQ